MEMETDDNHATMRESFGLVQKILLSDVLPSHSGKIWLKTCGKVSNLVWIFDNGLWRELGVSLPCPPAVRKKAGTRS